MTIPVVTRLSIFFAFFTVPFFTVKAQIGFGTNNPDPSAIVHIQDTTKGLLIPRMTMAQKMAIPNPAKGLMIFQTDSTEGFWYYNGTQWTSIINNYKQTLVLTGDISNSEAAAKIAREVGPATQEIRIYNCDNLTSVDLSMVTNLTELYMQENSVLQTVNLSNLKAVDANINIMSCPSLSTLTLPQLETVGNGINIYKTGLTQINLPALKKSTWSIDIASNQNLLTISIPLLASSPSHYMHFRINSNRILTSITAPSLNRVDDILLSYNTACTNVNFAALTSANKIYITNDSALSAISLPLLATVTGDINIENDTSLTSLSLGALTTAQNISITDSRKITALSLPQLANVNNTFTINTCKKIATLDLPLLASAGNITLQNLDALAAVDLPALTTVTTTASIQSCKSVTGVNLPVLTAVINLNMYNNNLLATLAVPLLTNAGTIYFNNNAACSALNFPSLTTLSGQSNLSIAGCSGLTNISFPNLNAAQNAEFYFNYNKLTSAAINALLNKFVSITPALTNRVFYFARQLPAAPPTGQGLIDKATLELSNTVWTD